MNKTITYRRTLKSLQQAALEMFRLYRAAPSEQTRMALVVTSQLLSEVTRQGKMTFPLPRVPSAIIQVDANGRVIWQSFGT